MTGHAVRLALTGILGIGLAVAAVAWPEADGAPTPAGASSGALDGGQLFQAKGCASCHTTAGQAGRISGVAPDLANVAAVAGERVEGLGPEAYVRQSIREPQAFVVPGFTSVSMPTLSISDAELDALVEHLLG